MSTYHLPLSNYFNLSGFNRCPLYDGLIIPYLKKDERPALEVVLTTALGDGERKPHNGAGGTAIINYELRKTVTGNE